MTKGKDKAALAILIGGPSKKKAGAAGEGDYSEDLEMASQDLLDAIESKDAAGVASAFKTMHELCSG